MAEASVASFSMCRDTDRLDPEHFRTSDLAAEAALRTGGGVRLGDPDVSRVFTGRTPTYDADGTIPVVRAGDLEAALIYPGCGPTFLLTGPRKGLVSLNRGDVLISSIGLGSIGKISLVLDPGNFVTVSEVTVARATSYPAVGIFAFLRSDLGQRLIAREISGATGQQHLLPQAVRRIYLPPPPSSAICQRLQRLVESARTFEEKARDEYQSLSELVAALGRAPGS